VNDESFARGIFPVVMATVPSFHPPVPLPHTVAFTPPAAES
jgi:hypothetical protein